MNGTHFEIWVVGAYFNTSVEGHTLRLWWRGYSLGIGWMGQT